MKKVIINRFRITDNYSLGKGYIEHEDGIIEYIGCTLERGWQDNKNYISCIPAGIYDLKLEWSPRFKKELWELYGVPNRRECKFHAANYWKQLNGCIALGKEHIDINGDGDPDVTFSMVTMSIFHKKMTGRIAKIKIYNISF